MSQKIMFSCFKEWYRNFMKKQQITSAMEANRCAISAIDCDDAKEYLEAYQELQEKDAASGTSEFFTPREGLLVAAIISYSRAFTNSHGGEFSSPKAKAAVSGTWMATNTSTTSRACCPTFSVTRTKV